MRTASELHRTFIVNVVIYVNSTYILARSICKQSTSLSRIKVFSLLIASFNV